MGFVQRLRTLAKIFLACFFGDLLRLEKLRNSTAGINLKYDLSLTGKLVRHMFVDDREQSFKAQLSQIDKQKERMISIHTKVTDNHKEMIVH